MNGSRSGRMPCARRLLLAVAVAVAIVTPPARAQWSTDTLSRPRYNLAATTVGTKAFFAGGFEAQHSPSDLVDIYDASTGTWSLARLSAPGNLEGATTVGTKALFVAQGFMDVYDDATGEWSTATIPEWPATARVVASVGTKLFFAGGWIAHNAQHPTDAVDIYDDATGSWSTARLSVPRGVISATTVGSKVLFAGGMEVFPTTSDVVDIYDDATGTWSTAVLSQARWEISATTAGSKAVFAGGSHNWNGNISGVIDIYDDATGTWSSTNLSVIRSATAAAVGTEALFVGGIEQSIPHDPSSLVDILDTDQGSWTAANVSAARWRLAATSVGSQALFAGGRDGNWWDWVPSDLVVIYTGLEAEPYCFGDGSGAPCPCDNPGGAGEGCANSSGAGGHLSARGSASVALDDLTFVASQLPPAQPALLFVGQDAVGGGEGHPLGDGMRCAGGGVLRLGLARSEASGNADWERGLGGLGRWDAGDTRRFQAWYRDDDGPCGSGFNLTIGLEVLFAP